jgi:Na+-transporting NADH:ubiquinone oxidoreductase subunit D
MAKVPLKNYLLDPIWKNNQVLAAVLGICSALGITSTLKVSITMGLAVIFVTGLSSLLVSLLRRHTPDSVRMITQLAIISMLVIVVDQFLRAFFFDLAKELSVYVGLIITNCIVMGRAEAMAKNNPPLPAFIDGIGSGLGYTLVLCIVGFIRELFGFGTLLGLPVIPETWYATATNPNGYQNFNLMVLPPAAFFIIGFLIFILNRTQRKNV